MPAALDEDELGAEELGAEELEELEDEEPAAGVAVFDVFEAHPATTINAATDTPDSTME